MSALNASAPGANLFSHFKAMCTNGKMDFAPSVRYDFMVVYSSEKANIADTLSRLNSNKHLDKGDDFDWVSQIVENSVQNLSFVVFKFYLVLDRGPQSS